MPAPRWKTPCAIIPRPSMGEQLRRSTLTDKTELTPNEALAALLSEVRAIHKRLSVIQSWVAFAGIVLLIEIVFSACRAVLGL